MSEANFEPGEGFFSLERPRPLTRIAAASHRRSTLSHKGRGKKSVKRGEMGNAPYFPPSGGRPTLS